MATPSLYTFSEYSSDWPAAFRREAERIQSLLGPEIIVVHHVGSTSIPGLAAKPILDLLPVVHDILRIDVLTSVLVGAGYHAWGECGLRGRRYFTKDRESFRTHNVHVYQVGHPDIERLLAFCSYLRAHEKTRYEYELVKRQAYALHPDDIAAYNDAKSEWIQRIEPLALEEYSKGVK